MCNLGNLEDFCMNCRCPVIGHVQFLSNVLSVQVHQLGKSKEECIACIHATTICPTGVQLQDMYSLYHMS